MEVDSINIACDTPSIGVAKEEPYRLPRRCRRSRESCVGVETMKQGPSERRLRIPVRSVEGKWEFLFGGQVPVKDHAIAELVINRGSIDDPSFLAKMDCRESYKILGERTALLVVLNEKDSYPLDENLRKHLKRCNNIEGEIVCDPFSSKMYFVTIWIDAANEKQKRALDTTDGGLWLLTHGFDAIGLASTTIRLPDGIVPNPVESLNHAYTRLSELFEPWRISHTGNIYKQILYREQNGKWYPLDLLRNRVLVKKEHEIARAHWRIFLAKMSGAHSG